MIEKQFAPDRHDPWQTWPVRVVRMRSEAPSVFTCELAFEQPRRIERLSGSQVPVSGPGAVVADAAAENSAASVYQFLPGQFNMLYVPGVGETAISIAGVSANEPAGLLHTIRAVGNVTRSIERGGLGMSLGLRGPFGTSWPLEELQAADEQRDVIVVAGGIGLAPLRSLVHHVAALRPAFGNVHVLVGARTPDDLIYENEFPDWQAAGIQLEVTVDRPAAKWQGNVGVVTLLLERLKLADASRTLVMTCGPEVMMRYVAKSAMARGIPGENIWVTLERNMNCAIGLCGHCQLGPAFICKDGPVFRYDRISPLMRVLEL